MYVESCMILVVVNRLSRPVVVLDGLPGLYGFKYDSATACELLLYLYSYKLVGSATHRAKYYVIVLCAYGIPQLVVKKYQQRRRGQWHQSIHWDLLPPLELEEELGSPCCWDDEHLAKAPQSGVWCRRTDQFIRIQVQWQSASSRTVILEPI